MTTVSTRYMPEVFSLNADIASWAKRFRLRLSCSAGSMVPQLKTTSDRGDGKADDTSPLRPRAIIHRDSGESQHIRQRKPHQRGAMAQATIGHDFLRRIRAN